MDYLLVLRKLSVEGANAIAGITWGFPAITQFMGYMHAMQRRLSETWDVEFTGCGVVCHRHQIQAFIAGGFGDSVFSLTRNPLDKSGKSSSFVEEGKMNMSVSLIFGVEDNYGLRDEEKDQLCQRAQQLAQRQRLAGGIVTNHPTAKMVNVSEAKNHPAKLLRSLLPGFALIGRHDLMTELQTNTKHDAITPVLEAWLSASSMEYRAERTSEDSDQASWPRVEKPYTGWIKPITVGYRAISPLYDPGTVKKTRDAKTPSRFVENIYSLGEWISPHRVESVDELLWRYQTTPDGDYRCINSKF